MANINLNEYKAESVDKEGWTIHPLPLLTAVGNGRGGGDFQDGIGIEWLGLWAWHLLAYLGNTFATTANARNKASHYIDAINQLAPNAYAPRKKRSRIFKAFCDALGVTDLSAGSEYQRLFAQFADELSTKKIDYKLFVSISPAHFLTMSNPKKDKRGTTRQLFMYRTNNGLLLQSRLYNTSGRACGAQAESKPYRDLVQRELSELECVLNKRINRSELENTIEKINEIIVMVKFMSGKPF